MNDKDAIKLLEEKGLTLKERMSIIGALNNSRPLINNRIATSFYKDETQYHSLIPEVSSLIFKSPEEVILINGMFDNMKEYEANEFRNMIPFIFRMLKIESEWT